jgi:hypothetical protein
MSLARRVRTPFVVTVGQVPDEELPVLATLLEWRPS